MTSGVKEQQQRSYLMSDQTVMAQSQILNLILKKLLQLNLWNTSLRRDKVRNHMRLIKNRYHVNSWISEMRIT